MKDAVKLTGRRIDSTCLKCGKPALSFRGMLAVWRFILDGICQACQDKNNE